MNKDINNVCKKQKNCKRCKYPCVDNGENLKVITINELREMGYVLCEDYTEEDIYIK